VTPRLKTVPASGPPTLAFVAAGRAPDRTVPRWRSVDQRLTDALLVVGTLGASLIAAFAVHPHDEYHDANGWTALLIVAATVPLAARRRAPLLVFAVTTGAVLALPIAHFDAGATPVAVWIALYSLAAHSDLHRSLVGVASVPLVMAIVWASARTEFGWPEYLVNIVIFEAAWVTGNNIRTRRAYLRELEDRASRLEREREARAERAVDEERARIARELHDVVAHSMSVMTVQAGAARRIIDQDPGRARDALGTIERTGRQALGEMRRILEVLRDRASGGDRAPLPGLDRLPDLVDQLHLSGLPVELLVEGAARPLPQGVDLTAYRIIQEALTNTLKHAGPARADVTVRYSSGAVDIEVRDDGRGITAAANGGPAEGHGLLGMRERVAVFGGRLHAGPRPGGGYQIRAHLPFDQPIDALEAM
jgi:signal transduction histidine kinase